MTACFDEPSGESTKHLPGAVTGVDIPENVVSPTASFPLNKQAVTINTSKTYQTMEGIGASDCWLGEFVGKYFPGNRSDAATWLFSRQVINGQPQGIGLSMWRVNLGGGSLEQGDESKIVNVTSRAGTYLMPGANYDWSSCSGQQYFMQQAKNNGVEKFVLFSNSPLVQWTKNGLATKIGEPNNGHTNLKDDCYADFAEYMSTVAEHFIADGYNISHISPANEPQYSWDGDNQEGSSWFNTEIAKLAREMDKSLTDHGLETNILLGEAGSYAALYSEGDNQANVIDRMFTTGSDAYVGDLKHVDMLISGHSYWTTKNWDEMRSVRSRLAEKAASKGVRVWQTEWSMLGDAPEDLEGGYDNATEFDIAMYMSRIIHNDFTVANVGSWCYWTAFGTEAWGQKNRFELIFATPEGGAYNGNWFVQGQLQANPNLWVLGNYSLCIRPGYERVELEMPQNKDFFGSAWKSPDGATIVCVYTNYDKKNGVTIDNKSVFGSNPRGVRRLTTTASKNLKEDWFKVGDPVFLDPASVTTVVYYF